jgi:predicted metalloendopeptidase
VTHSFDDQASRIESWSAESQAKYKERVKCIVNQYSGMRVVEVEELNKEYNNDDTPFYLNGTLTKNEDIA